jgi:hypothetical protein
LENKNMAAKSEAVNLTGKEFVITREYAAPREMVWRACTEAKHLGNGGGRADFPRRFANGTRSRAIKFTSSCARRMATVSRWAVNFWKLCRPNDW